MLDDASKPPALSLPEKAPSTHPISRWLLHGHRLDESEHVERGHAWWRVLWLTGVDYFSTLGYQPGIALLAAGLLSPLATILLVSLTLFGAVPVYAMVASRSFAGQGSIAMLEGLLPGWRGKLLVLILLGFASTDFIITITLSAADAAEHLVHNPLLEHYLRGHEISVTLVLVAVLTGVFLRGFREAIGIATAIAIPYLVLNLIVLGRCLLEIAAHPELVRSWEDAVSARGDLTMIAIACGLVFPKLALGMSGFETGVAIMPQVAGDDPPGAHPAQRIRATRKLLVVAALIMCTLLLMSSFATALLIPEHEYREGGPAAGRAIAHLAHRLLGSTFGTLYDFSTIAILWFAGASAMAGMLNLIPRYLPRFGMAPEWIAHQRPLVLVLFVLCTIVTLIFRADVEAQGGAYATGVLVLMLSACFAVALDLVNEAKACSERRRRVKLIGQSGYYWVIVAVFAYTLTMNVVERTDGVVIASVFIAFTLMVGALSRTWRSIELRVSEVTFRQPSSVELWSEMIGKKVHAVPLRTSSSSARHRKARELRRFYKIEGPLAFLHVNLVDNRSDFLTPLQVTVAKEGEDYVVEVFGAVAIANTLAFMTELLDPISVFLGLTRSHLMVQSIKYLLWGEGETGVMVYMILLRRWRSRGIAAHLRPNIFMLSN